MSGAINLGNYRTMSQNAKRIEGSLSSKTPKTRVTNNNIRGKPLDKITAEQMKAASKPHLSIYNQDFGDRRSSNPSVENSQAARIAVTNANALPATTKNNPSTGHKSQPVLQTLPKLENKMASSNSRSDLSRNATQRNEVENHSQGHKCGDTRSESNFGIKTSYLLKLDPQAVHEDLLRSYAMNPYVTVNDEVEFFEIIRRLDMCGHCWCGQQKYYTAPFKLKQKGPGTTLYQKDYVKHPLETNGPKVKNDFYGTFNIQEPMDFGTTMRNDYKPWNAEAPKRATMGGKTGASGIPFGGRSGYKAEYIDWGAMPVNYEKAPHNITVIKEMPLGGKTAYQENFGHPGATDRAKPVDKDLWKHKTGKSPLSPGIPFLGETTHNKTYKPFKVGGAPMFPIMDEYEPTEAYPDQFRSTYTQEYTAPQKWKCPARIFIDRHPHPREKHLKK